MSDQTNYLLKDTPEAHAQFAHIKALLKSQEPENIELAYALLGGGGVPNDPEFIVKLKQTKERILLCARFGLTTVLDTITQLNLKSEDEEQLDEWQMALPLFKRLRKLKVKFDDWGKLFGKFTETSSLELLQVTGKNEDFLPKGFAHLKNLRIWLVEGDAAFWDKHGVFGALQKLEYFYCDRFFVEGEEEVFSIKDLCVLSRLKKMHIKRFRLNEVPKEISQLQYLESVTFERNNLKHLPEVFSQCHKLKTLIFNDQQIKDNDVIPEKLPQQLQHLSIKENPLGNLSPTLFELPGLKSLNLTNCDISKLPELTRESSLTWLSLQRNYFTILPVSFGYLTNTQWLNLSHCFLKHIACDLKKMQNLQVLNLDSNPIQYLPPTAGELPRLKELRVGTNPYYYPCFDTKLEYVPKLKSPVPEKRKYTLDFLPVEYNNPPESFTCLLADIDEERVNDNIHLADIEFIDYALDRNTYYYAKPLLHQQKKVLDVLENSNNWLYSINRLKNEFEALCLPAIVSDDVLENAFTRFWFDQQEHRLDFPYTLPSRYIAKEALHDFLLDEDELSDMHWEFLYTFAEEYWELLNEETSWEFDRDENLREEPNAYIIYDYYGEELARKPITDEYKSFLHNEVVKDLLHERQLGYDSMEAEFLYQYDKHLYYLDNNFFAFENDDDVWDNYMPSSRQALSDRMLVEEGLSFFVV